MYDTNMYNVYVCVYMIIVYSDGMCIMCMYNMYMYNVCSDGSIVLLAINCVWCMCMCNVYNVSVSACVKREVRW